MGSQGVDHVTNIIENTFIHSILSEYETMIQLSPDSSYLSLLKKGRPQLLGIFETLKKSGSNTDSAREKLNKKYSNKLLIQLSIIRLMFHVLLIWENVVLQVVIIS